MLNATLKEILIRALGHGLTERGFELLTGSAGAKGWVVPRGENPSIKIFATETNDALARQSLEQHIKALTQLLEDASIPFTHEEFMTRVVDQIGASFPQLQQAYCEVFFVQKTTTPTHSEATIATEP